MHRVSFVLLPFCFYLVLAVNRDNFKSCKLSSFCNRQRELKPESLSYSVVPDSLRLTTYGLVANLSRTPGTQFLTIDVSYLDFSTFRVVIDEPDVEQSRYRLSPGDALREEPQRLPVNVVRVGQTISLTGKTGEKAVVSLDPFTIDFYMDHTVVAQINHRNLLNFENKNLFPKSEEPMDSSDTNEGSKDSAMASTMAPEETSIDDSTELPPPEAGMPLDEPEIGKQEEPENVNDALPTDEEHPNVAEGSEEQSPDTKTVNPKPADPFPWAEDFKGHRDTRPYGPMSISLDFDFPGFSHAFGIPEHADNFVLKSTESGDPYRLYNLDVFEYELDNPMALYGSVPVMWTVNANYTVGIFWHNPSETWVDVAYSDRHNGGFLSKIPRLFMTPPEKQVKTRWMSETGVLDVFVMLGKEPSAVSRAYAHLTGTTPLPPLFSLAYHQCRWNYNDEQDVLSIDQRFDDTDIPLDVIWLDIEHADGKRYFTWDKVKFPDPGRMVDKLDKHGRKLVTVVDPHIKQDANWPLYTDGAAKNYYIKTHDGSDYIGWCWPGSSAWPDFTNHIVRRWWAELFLTYDPVRIDTMFSWNDMGEPSIFNGPEITSLKDTVHVGHREHRDVHNIYGLHVHRSTWEGHLLRSKHLERPFVLTRAFFAGSQRTAAIWTGDNKAAWDHLKISVPMLLSLSLTGITFCGADVGGFFGNPEPELLTRWYQAAAFQPFFRAHAHIDTKRREPWTLPKEYMKVVREAIVERYNLLPYWYTMFARAEADGQPVLAPLWYHFRQTAATYDLDHEYMIGEALLVRPVTSEGATQVDVYLPPGTWYHYPTMEEFAGDREFRFPVQLSTIPTFYRGGWIVPRRERTRRSSWSMQWDPFTLFVFIDASLQQAHGYLYDDDYHSISRDTAQFYRIEFDISRDPLSQNVAGGRLHAHRLPLPGTTVLPQDDLTKLRDLSIERIVFVGMQLPLQRVTLITNSGDHQPVKFIQEPSQMADQKYMGTRKEGVVVVRFHPLHLASDWSLHLISGTELKAEL